MGLSDFTEPRRKIRTMADSNAVQSQVAPKDESTFDVDLSGLTDEEKKYVKLAADSDGARTKDEDVQKAKVIADNIKTVEDTGGVTGEAQMTMAFYEALKPENQAAIDRVAPQQLDQFLKDQNLIAEFGKSAVDKVNAVVDNMLVDQAKVKIPEIDSLLTEANRDLDNYVATYKDEISLDKKESKFASWFRNKKRKVVDWGFEQQTLTKKLDILTGKLITKREELKKTFYHIEQLLNENQKSTNGMVGFLAALESIHAEALRRASALEKQLSTIDKNSPDYQAVADRLATMAEVSNAIEQQHANYMARLAVAWSANSQIRNLQRVQNTVLRNIAQVIQHTIPMMKMSIAQIQVISTTKDAAHATDVAKSTNEAVTNMLISLQKNDLPDLEARAQAPIMSADTINAFAEGVEEANKRLVEAIKAGREERTKVEQAVLNASTKIKASDELRDQKLVEALLGEREENRRLREQFEHTAENAYTAPEEDAIIMDSTISNMYNNNDNA